MANFDLGQKIKADKDLSSMTLKKFFKERLDKSCTYKVLSDNETSMVVAGKVNEGLLTKITKFDATITFSTENNKARVSAVGKSAGNWVFWLFIIIGFFNGITLIVAIILHLLQRNKPKEVLEGILKAMEAEFGTI